MMEHMTDENEHKAPEHLTSDQRKWDMIFRLYCILTYPFALLGRIYDHRYPYKPTHHESPKK